MKSSIYTGEREKAFDSYLTDDKARKNRQECRDAFQQMFHSSRSTLLWKEHAQQERKGGDKHEDIVDHEATHVSLGEGNRVQGVCCCGADGTEDADGHLDRVDIDMSKYEQPPKEAKKKE